MKATITLANPDSVEAKITLRSTIGELKQLEGQLQNLYPAWEFGAYLRKAIQAAEAMANVTIDD